MGELGVERKNGREIVVIFKSAMAVRSSTARRQGRLALWRGVGLL